jgi:hypothetical protein
MTQGDGPSLWQGSSTDASLRLTYQKTIQQVGGDVWATRYFQANAGFIPESQAKD